MSDTQDDSQKTEEPTARKLSEARKKGQVAQSKEVTNLASFVGLTFLVATLGPYMALQLHGSLAVVMEQAALADIDAGSAGDAWWSAA